MSTSVCNKQVIRFDISCSHSPSRMAWWCTTNVVISPAQDFTLCCLLAVLWRDLPMNIWHLLL